MKFKSTYIFAAVVVGVGIFTYLDYQNGIKEKATKEKQEALLPEWNESSVDEVKLVRDDSSVYLKKEKGQWKILEPIKDNAVNSSVETLIRNMISDKVKSVGTEGSIDWGLYGFETAKRFVELVDQKSKKETIHVSNKKTYDGKTYLRLDKNNKLMLASTSWDYWLTKKVRDLRDKKVVKVNGQIERLAIKKKKILELQRGPQGWLLPDDIKFKVNQTKVTSALSAIKSLNASDVVSETKDKKNLKKYKLIHPAVEISMVVKGEKAPVELKLSSPQGKSNEVYLISNSKPFIYKIYKSNMDKMIIAKNDLKKRATKSNPKKKGPGKTGAFKIPKVSAPSDH